MTPFTSSPRYAGLLTSGSSMAPGFSTRRKSLQAASDTAASTAAPTKAAPRRSMRLLMSVTSEGQVEHGRDASRHRHRVDVAADERVGDGVLSPVRVDLRV